MSIFSSRPALLLAALLLAALALDRAALALGEAALRHSGFRYSRLYFARIDADLAVFGNSRAVHGFHAPTLERALCRPAVNLAYNGLDMAAVAALARDAAERMPGLDIAVIEVTALFSPGHGVPDLAPYAGQSPRLAALLAARVEGEGALPWRRAVAGLALNSEMFWRALAYTGRSDQGWINSGGPPHSAALAAFRARAPDRFAARPGAEEALRALLADLRNRGIRPVLVAAPYHPAARARLSPGWAGRLGDRVGAPVLDLTALTPGDRNFADPLHGNLAGAGAVARALAPVLGACEGGA